MFINRLKSLFVKCLMDGNNGTELGHNCSHTDKETNQYGKIKIGNSCLLSQVYNCESNLKSLKNNSGYITTWGTSKFYENLYEII